MDKVVYDRIEDVLSRIESLYGRVEDTYLVAKDILMGTNIADWIADLKDFGKSSVTYADASRMNTLIANEDAAKNADVNQILFDWSLDNSTLGTFLESCIGDTSSASFEAVTTFQTLIDTATQEIFTNSVLSGFVASNHSAVKALYNNYSTIKNYQSEQSFAQAFSGKTSKYTLSNFGNDSDDRHPLYDDVYVTTIFLNRNNDSTTIKVTITHPDDTTTVKTFNSSWEGAFTYDVNMFAKAVTSDVVNASQSHPLTEINIYAV